MRKRAKILQIFLKYIVCDQVQKNNKKNKKSTCIFLLRRVYSQLL